MAEALIGRWDYDSVEGLEEYMSAAGLPEEMKEMARNTKPQVEIGKDGENWLIKTTVGDKEIVTSYPVGVEVDTVNIMGKAIKGLLKVTDTGLVEIQKAGEMEITIERSIENGDFCAKMSVNGVQAKAKFVKA